MLESLTGEFHKKFLAKLVAVGPLQQSTRLTAPEGVQCAKLRISYSHGALVATSTSENQSVLLPKGVTVELRHSGCRLLVKERPLVGVPKEAMARPIPATTVH
jgi:hypothetical protein